MTRLVARLFAVGILLSCSLCLAQPLPIFKIHSEGTTYSILVGSAHAGFLGSNPIDSQSVKELRRAKHVYFESLPWSQEVTTKIQQLLRNSLSREHLNEVYVKLGAHISRYQNGTGLAHLLDRLREMNIHPLLAHYFILASCKLKETGRSLDADIKSVLSESAQIGELEDPILLYSEGAAVPIAQWSIHLERVSEFATGTLCGEIVEQSMRGWSNQLLTGDIEHLTTSYANFHEETLGSDLVYRRVEFSERRQRYLVDRIAKLHNLHPAAFVVGATHLGGNAGLVAELRRRGLRVSLLER